MNIVITPMSAFMLFIALCVIWTAIMLTARRVGWQADLQRWYNKLPEGVIHLQDTAEVKFDCNEHLLHHRLKHEMSDYLLTLPTSHQQFVVCVQNETGKRFLVGIALNGEVKPNHYYSDFMLAKVILSENDYVGTIVDMQSRYCPPELC